MSFFLEEARLWRYIKEITITLLPLIRKRDDRKN